MDEPAPCLRIHLLDVAKQDGRKRRVLGLPLTIGIVAGAIR
jgi:hypothetical protein